MRTPVASRLPGLALAKQHRTENSGVLVTVVCHLAEILPLLRCACIEDSSLFLITGTQLGFIEETGADGDD